MVLRCVERAICCGVIDSAEIIHLSLMDFKEEGMLVRVLSFVCFIPKVKVGLRGSCTILLRKSPTALTPNYHTLYMRWPGGNIYTLEYRRMANPERKSRALWSPPLIEWRCHCINITAMHAIRLMLCGGSWSFGSPTNPSVAFAGNPSSQGF